MMTAAAPTAIDGSGSPPHAPARGEPRRGPRLWGPGRALQGSFRMTPARVLIAVPDAALLDAYRRRLTADGFEVETARDGLDCVHRVRAFAPEVLVLSTALPWGGGDGVLAVMHEEARLSYIP